MKISTASTNGSDQKSHIMPAEPALLRPNLESLLSAVGVDREAKVLRGYVVAQAGVFKDKRGEFTEEGLNAIVNIINGKPKGVKVRFTHPSLSNDGLGKFLGRAKDARLDTAKNGKGEEVIAVRADLHFDQTALKEPPTGGRPLGEYILDLAESDPDALSSSIALFHDDLELRDKVDSEGKVQKDAPRVWIPHNLHASDLVDTGDAVDGLLSVDDLPDAAVRRGCELLDRVFDGQPAEVLKARSLSWLNKYIQLRHPGEALIGDDVEELKQKLALTEGQLNVSATEIDVLQSEVQRLVTENANLQAENQHLEVERIFDDELKGKVKAGERDAYFKTALNLRKAGKEKGSDFAIFIASLKNRDANLIDTKEIAGGVGHSLSPQTVVDDPNEEKQEVAGFLMP